MVSVLRDSARRLLTKLLNRPIVGCSLPYSKVVMESEKEFSRLKALLPDTDGYELHPFRVGSYNEVSGACFQLNFNNDAMGVVLLNTPSFFETTFKEWLCAKKRRTETLEEFAERFPSGPVQAFFTDKMDDVRQAMEPTELAVIHDFEVLPNRRPKVVMSTVGHVAGAAFFYHPPEEALGRTDPSKKRRTGVSLHPKYGGYFAYRAVIVFPKVLLPSEFREHRAPMLLKTIEEQDEAVELFNTRWWEGKFRDCGDPQEKYSELQLKYFSSLPMKRWPMIAHWFTS